MRARPVITRPSVLCLVALLAGCTSWQRVGDPAGPTTPEDELLQLFNPAALYRSLDRMVSQTGVPFVASVAALPGPGDSTRVLVGVSLANRALAFERVGDIYQARYRVEYTLTRTGGAPITAGREAVVRVASLQEALRTDESILLQQELMAVPGDYAVSVRVSDRSSNLSGVAADSVNVVRFGAGSITAPILVYDVRGRGTRRDSVGIVLNPRGTIAYGGDTLLIYLEGVGFTAPAAVPLQVRDMRDSVVLDTELRFTGRREVESQVVRVAPDSAPLGQLQVVVGTGAEARSTSGIVSFSGNWMVTNFDDLLSLLRYFGEDTRVARMREASPENRPDLWREFYTSTDPNSLTAENEALDAYFARLAIANEQYRDEGIPGWRTDRGEVLVTLGQPDEVYDAASQQQGRFVRWAYYDHRIALVFQDVTGFGRYRLTPQSRVDFDRVKNRVQRRP
jgi:GWxTD domain-containing protein